MKNTFAVTMTLLLALTLGGSIAGYRVATTPHHAEEEAKGGAESIGDPTVQDVKSEDVPTAQSSATGAAGAAGAQGDVRPDQIGGTTSGDNGAVAVPGGQAGGGAEEAPDTEQGDEASEPAPSTVGSPSAPESGGGGSQVGQTGASNVERSSAANPTLSDEKAAEVSDALGGEADGGDQGQEGQTNIGNDPEAEQLAPESEGEPSEGEPEGSAEPTGAAAGVAGAVTASAAGDAGAGQPVFVSNCSGCHGANGQGVVGPSLVTADGPRSWTLAQFITTLREGRTPERELNATMPRYSEAQLSDAQVADLHAYIKTLN